MSILIQSFLNGICSGSIYGLIALSLSLLFGVMKIINFAHGAFLMMAMYFTLWICRYLGLHPLLTLLIVPPSMFAVGYLTQRFLIKSIYEKETDREPIGVLIFTTGLWIFLDSLFLLFAGPDAQVIKHGYVNQTLVLGDFIFSYTQIFGLLFSVLVGFAFFLFLKKTKTGRAIRATGQDREAASVIGVNSYRIYDISFGIGMAILGAAGALLLPLYSVYPFVGDVFGMRAFVIVVLGGMGSLSGAFWGGLIIGLIESVGAQFLPATFTEALILIIFLIILYFKPSGLFGLESE
jgi:branched-chain amino acid transport system permease protein